MIPAEQLKSNSVNILLVDDRWENLVTLAAVLDNPEYNLVKAASGRDALKCLLNDDFALILLDVQMPILDGFETAALIKQRERSSRIPIIFVTGVGLDDPFVFKGYGAGAVDYIIKPFDPSILRSKVAVFAELYRKTRQIQVQAEQLRLQERQALEQEKTKLELLLLRREQVANQKYRDLVDGINHGVVWAADPQLDSFSFVSAVAKDILGYPVEAWLTEPGFWWKHLHEDDREPVSAALKHGLALGTDFRFHHRFLKADQSYVWFQTWVRVSRDGADAIEARGLSVDITDLKKAEQAAQEAINTRDEFLSIASHELKTPLTPLKLHVQSLRLLSRKGLSSEVMSEKISRVVESSDRQICRLTKLVDELLDVSRITNGKLVLEPEDLDLVELIRELCLRFESEIAQAGCAVQLELPDSVPGKWDRLRIEQVLTNLLTNALKYGEAKPVNIRLVANDTDVTVSVQDQGIGITPEAQARIFKRFERAVSPANFGGLGLGLYIVSQILDAHRGRIRVESELGKGSTFTVNLPKRFQGSGIKTETVNESVLVERNL